MSPSPTPSRLAVITGGTRGIGAAISRRLSADGDRVVALYGRDDDAAQLFAAETGITVKRCDVSDFDACTRIIGALEDELGGVDILVNNAGITRDGMLHKASWENWHEVIRTNLYSAFNMTRPIIAGMRARRFGRIIMISSINGQKGQMGQTNYCAAKAGLTGFAKALAQETAAFGITVNCVAPGYVATDMVNAVAPAIRDKIIANIPVGRLGAVEEIAACVSFLTANEAAFITGSTLSVNGGHYMLG